MTYREVFEKARLEGAFWADAAIANTGAKVDEEACSDTPHHAVSGAFAWRTSPEGERFWSSVYQFGDQIEGDREALCRRILSLNFEKSENLGKLRTIKSLIGEV